MNFLTPQFSRRSLLLTALFTALSTNVSFGNALSNGSFETPVVTPGTFQNISPGGEPAGFDWTVASGNIDLAGPNPFVLFPPFEGNQAVDLNGFVPGSLFQDFPTVAGLQYQLTFAYADNPIAGGVSTADVLVTDVLSSGILLSDAVSHSTSTNSPPDGDWDVYSDVFTATGASTRVLFASTSGGGASDGILLDDVSVEEVPEPGALLLAGCALIAVLGETQRRLLRAKSVRA